MTNAAEERLLAAVTEGGNRARFVTAIRRSLARTPSAPSKPEIEEALARLEAQGKLLVREHYCADPHLEGVDLRIAGVLLPDETEVGDPISACVREIEATWQEWITGYLAEHRCS
jgi:hypothetical protein